MSVPPYFTGEVHVFRTCAIPSGHCLIRLAANVDVDGPVGHGRDQVVAARSGHSRIHPGVCLAGPDRSDRALSRRRTADLVDDHVVALCLQLPYGVVGVGQPDGAAAAGPANPILAARALAVAAR